MHINTPARLLVATTLAALTSWTWIGCSKDSAKKPPPVAPPDDLGIAVPSTDSMWALAPADTQVALVAGPGTGELLLAAVLELQESMGQHPMGSKLLAEMKRDMPPDMPPNVLDRAYHKQIGLDLALPAALFMTSDEQPMVVLPVSDRAAFRALVGGTQDSATGVDILDDDMRCKDISGAYVCAKTDEMLASVGQGKDLAQAVAKLDKDLRGHMEVYVSGAQMRKEQDDGDLDEVMDVTGFHAAVQLERGGFNARAFLAGRIKHPAVAAASQVSSRLAKRVADEQPAGFWRLRVPLAQLIPPEAAAQLAPAAAFVQLDAKADILDNLSGEMLMYAVAQKGIGVMLEIGAKDGKRLQPIINTACTMAKAQLPPEAAAMVDISLDKDRCLVAVDPSKLGPLMPPNMPEIGPIELEFSTTADSMAVRLNMATKHQSNTVAASPAGRDLLVGSWNLALWGYGAFTSMYDPSFMDAMRQVPEFNDSEDLDKALFGFWVLGHLSEMGMGAAVREDGMHVMLRAGTQWANPEPVLREYQGALASLLQGDAGAADKLSALAEKSPASPYGRSYRAGTGGGPMASVALVGILAAVAIPSFTRYRDKAEEAEKGADIMEEAAMEEAAMEEAAMEEALRAAEEAAQAAKAAEAIDN